MKPDMRFKFGQWLPDQADLDNPGVIDAANAIWSAGGYRPYIPLVTGGSALQGGIVVEAMRAFKSGAPLLYAISTDGTAHSYIQALSGTGTAFTNLTPGSGLTNSLIWSMTQFNNIVVATNGIEVPQYNALTLATPFAKLTGPYGDAPLAQVVGTFNQFVILGNLVPTGANYLQWSGINAPFNWPTPQSADAIAQQSGQQYLDAGLGDIQAIVNGDQWGMVLCTAGIVRMTYTGGNTVLQFDTIYRGPTDSSVRTWIKVGAVVFMLSNAGVLRSDGTSVQPIGSGRIDRWLLNNADFSITQNFSVGADYVNKIIYWTFPLIGNGGVPNAWLAYNYVEDKFTHGTDAVKVYIRTDENWQVLERTIGGSLEAFGTNAKLGTFSGTPGVATLVTPEAEFNPGKRAIVSSVSPEITGTSALTVKIGSRTKQTDTVTFTSSLSPDAFTGDCNFYVDNRYHRAQFDITGNFTQAMGGTFDAQASSSF